MSLRHRTPFLTDKSLWSIVIRCRSLKGNKASITTGGLVFSGFESLDSYPIVKVPKIRGFLHFAPLSTNRIFLNFGTEEPHLIGIHLRSFSICFPRCLRVIDNCCFGTF